MKLQRFFAISLFVLCSAASLSAAGLTVTTSALSDGTVGSVYFKSLDVTGATATPPYTWSVVTGSLPPGLSLSTSGTISGTPTLAGRFPFRVHVVDSIANTGDQDLAITVQPLITTTSIPNGAVGVAYSPVTLTASPSAATFSWSAVSGLPPGLSLSASGVLSGTPTTAGTFNANISITDGGPLNASKTLPITIQPPLTIPAATLPLGIVGVFYVQSLVATGPTPITFSVVSGILPPGLGLAGNGTLTGTPSIAGSFTFTVQATGGDPVQTAQRSFIIVINAALSITTSILPNATLGVAYPSTALAATGGRTPYTWSNTGAPLPPGMSFSAGGVLSGTPTVPGSYSLTIQVADTGDSFIPSQTATRTLTLLVTGVLTISTPSLPSGSIGTPYTQTLSVTSGTTPLQWSVSSGTLPAGLTLSTSGTISGVPTAAGTSSVTFSVTDNSIPPQTATKTLSITIITPTLTITTPSPIPAGVIGVFYLLQLAASGPSPVAWSVIGGVLPPGLSLSPTGSLTGAPGIAGAFDFIVQATGGATGVDPLQTATKSLHIVINTALTISTTTLPPGTLSVPYTITTLAASGGLSPYTWVALAPPPPGLTLSTGGVLSGTPTTVGTFAMPVQVSDSSSPALQATRTFTITVSTQLTITTTTLANGAVGKAYSQALTGAAGTTPYTWTVTGGTTLPGGLTLSSDGTLSGTPTADGTFSFTVGISDSGSPPQTASKALSLTIQPALAITTASPLPLGIVGAFYSQQIESSGPTGVTWSVVSGIAAPGLVLTASGTLAGTPGVAGTYDFTIQAAGGDPAQTARKTFRLIVNTALTITTAAGLPDGTVSVPYSTSLVATGGLPSYTWSNPGRGGVPPGLTVSSSGVLSGTPTIPGTFQFTLQVADSFSPQQQATKTFTIVIATAVTITTTSLPHAIQNAAYSQQLQATGLTPLGWIVSSGTLPPGLNLTLGGLLQGTPTAAGTTTFSITVTDSRAATNTQTFTFVVDPPLPTLSVKSLPASLTPTQTSEVALSLSDPFPSPLSGTLVLTFRPKAEVSPIVASTGGNVEILVIDPATQFSTGTKTVSFTIPANTTAAVFASRITLLTGTVAGTVTLTANFDSGPTDVPVTTVEITPTPPQMTNVTAVRTPAGLDVQITGYSPTRRVTSAEFSFNVKTGNSTSVVSLPPKSVDADFVTWYRSLTSIQFGSSFSYVQSFNVQGNSSTVESVTVKLTNAQGSTTSATVKPQ